MYAVAFVYSPTTNNSNYQYLEQHLLVKAFYGM